MEYSELISAAGFNSSQRKFCKAAITKNIRLLVPAVFGKNIFPAMEVQIHGQ